MRMQEFDGWEFHLDDRLKAWSCKWGGFLAVDIVSLGCDVGSVVETFFFRNGKLYKVFGEAKNKPIEIKIDEKHKKIFCKV